MRIGVLTSHLKAASLNALPLFAYKLESGSTEAVATNQMHAIVF